MAAGYVDDHKLILYRDGAQPRDITAFASDMTLTDDLDTLAQSLRLRRLSRRGTSTRPSWRLHRAIRCA